MTNSMLPANGVTPVTTADIDTSTERMTHMSDIFNKAWSVVKAIPCRTCGGPRGPMDNHISGSCDKCVMRQGPNPVPEYDRG